MDEKPDETREPRCSDCRWVGLWPQPYGDVEYFCERRQVLMPSSLVARRSCAEFER